MSWSDAEIAELQRDSANAQGIVQCKNAPCFEEPEHAYTAFERCQLCTLNCNHDRAVALGFVRIPGTNRMLKRCAKCATDKPDAWLAQVPFVVFKWYLLGCLHAGEGAAVSLNWTPLKERLGL